MEVALVTMAARSMGEMVKDLLQLDKKLKAIIGVRGKMKKLKELSTIIDTVIEDVESRPLIDVAVKNLLRKMEFLSNDLEDVVDCYDIETLRKQRSRDSFRPVRDFFSSNNQVVLNCRIYGMIKAITDSLDSILLQKSFLLNLPQSSSHMSLNSNRVTHSRNSFDVIGRESEKNMIVDMLTKDDDDDDESSHGTLKVIAIVGMGGLGKTTLAQLVFDDERVKAHFASSRMWTVVGAEFDPTKIMKSVLELATCDPVSISETDLVRQNLEKALSGKRFLLVLDDAWNEDALKWGVLKAALTCGARGSKILVTTRSLHISSIMGSSNTTHQLQQLSKDDCLSLFQQFAFGDRAVDQSLMEIGGKIVEKCGGVPLAVISLGSMLHSTRDETYWSSVLNSKIWKLGDNENNLLVVLKLSYDTLSLRSKKCFTFGSLYPKNSAMVKDELIKLWIANGFVHSEGNFDAETIGNHVFTELVLKSFFHLASSKEHDFLWAPSNSKGYDFGDDSHVTKCTMHDLMHDLARSVAGDVYWNAKEDLAKDIGKRTYHLHTHIYFENLSTITQALGKKSLLRTLILNYFSLKADQLEFVFSELKFLRALDLTDNGIREVPTSIRNMIHLRHLNLSKNNIEVLPDSITHLSNLQYLDLSFNKGLRELPKALGNMQSLRDLDCRCHDLPSVFSKSDLGLTHMPCGLSRLTNLQSLRVFVAGDRTGACSIIEIENLKLCGEINIIFSENFTIYSCGGRKILKNKDLNELCLEFNRLERYDKEMLDDLCPNKSLKKLSIFNYGSRQFPAWLIDSQIPNLVEVSLKNCRDCEHIPPLGNLQFLKKLDLRFINGITQMGVEFHGRGGFPSLQELILNELYNLEEWSESHGVDELFPSLQWLRISNCPKLKCMPRLPKIQSLEIFYCSASLLSCVGRLTSLSVLRAMDIDGMTFFPSGCIRNLTSLTELRITRCRQLLSLPEDEMQHLTSLTKLQIIQCTKLHSLPGDEIQHLKMIRSLTIDRCYNLASFPSKVGHLNSLYFLRLAGCPSIILQPEELIQILNSVHEFEVTICGNKINLRGQLQYLHMLRELFITGEHDIYSNTQLGICCCDELELLMTAEPASSVLQHLHIDGISNLTTLPDWLQHLKSLRFLSIYNCSRLGTLPWGLKNLHMLETLRIIDCPQLKRRCQRDTGEDWPIISHVPYVDI